MYVVKAKAMVVDDIKKTVLTLNKIRVVNKKKKIINIYDRLLKSCLFKVNDS